MFAPGDLTSRASHRPSITLCTPLLAALVFPVATATRRISWQVTCSAVRQKRRVNVTKMMNATQLHDVHRGSQVRS